MIYNIMRIAKITTIMMKINITTADEMIIIMIRDKKICVMRSANIKNEKR